MPRGAVLLAAPDWRLAHWQDSLYPDGMPPEWRLAYFNTRFPGVWLSHAAWSGITPAMAEEWLSDTRAEFRFVLEAGAVITPQERRLLDILAPRLGLHGGLDHPDVLWFAPGADLRVLARSLRERAARGRMIYLLSRDADLATLGQVDTLLGLLDIGSADRVG